MSKQAHDTSPPEPCDDSGASEPPSGARPWLETKKPARYDYPTILESKGCVAPAQFAELAEAICGLPADFQLRWAALHGEHYSDRPSDLYEFDENCSEMIGETDILEKVVHDLDRYVEETAHRAYTADDADGSRCPLQCWEARTVADAACGLAQTLFEDHR